MSNKHIAISWAENSVKNNKSLVYSDQFFKPFSNTKTRKKIVDTLDKNGIVAWSDSKDGAFLFRKNDPRCIVSENNNYRAAVWEDNGNLIVFPTLVK